MVPIPTPILRFVHVDNLPTLIRRGGLHAPNCIPNDGLIYRPILSPIIQAARSVIPIRCGPGGTIHDYVPFYFGPLSPMMLNLKTGRVTGYAQGQEPLVYCVASAQAIARAGIGFVFTDGHALATPITAWFDDLVDLEKIDWPLVTQRYWQDSTHDMDRKRRKQAEFLVQHSCPWHCIERLVVINQAMKLRVENVLAQFPTSDHKNIEVNRDWYYHE
jgi:hypothetical protein